MDKKFCFSFYLGQGMFDNLQYQTLHWFRFYFRFKVKISECKKFSRLSNWWTCRKLKIGSKLKIGKSTDKIINVGIPTLSFCLLSRDPDVVGSRTFSIHPPLLVCGSSQRSILWQKSSAIASEVMACLDSCQPLVPSTGNMHQVCQPLSALGDNTNQRWVNLPRSRCRGCSEETRCWWGRRC